MGVYQRGQSLYFDFFDASGKRHQASSGFKAGQETEAKRAFEVLLRSIEAEKELGKKGDVEPKLVGKGVTYGMWARVWLRRRQNEKPQAAKEDKWKLERHILPALEHLKLAELRPRHCRAFVLEMKANPKLAKRSVRAIWSTLRTSLHDALVEELISQDPCILKRGDLPPAEDEDPDWRSTAVYERAEVEQLISEAGIPFYRRVLNGLLFLAGFRPSETFALRMKHYDATKEPLGRLDLMRAFNTNMRAEKGLKVAGKRRLVPVHPTLAALLAEWRLSGWEAHVGRKPGPEDLLIPTSKGTHMRVDVAYKEMLEDQETLGWRKRRLYDSRRTFISLCLADGASRDLLKWVTHGPKAGEVMDLYTSIPWAAICQEVLKLRVSLRKGRLVQLKASSTGSNCDSDCDSTHEEDNNMLYSQGRRRDLNPRPTDYKGVSGQGTSRNLGPNHKTSSGVVASPSRAETPKSWDPVTLSHTNVTEALEELSDYWEVSHDPRGLRQRMAALLALLGGESP